MEDFWWIFATVFSLGELNWIIGRLRKVKWNDGRQLIKLQCSFDVRNSSQNVCRTTMQMHHRQVFSCAHFYLLRRFCFVLSRLRRRRLKNEHRHTCVGRSEEATRDPVFARGKLSLKKSSGNFCLCIHHQLSVSRWKIKSISKVDVNE